jgi:hypothetical protein
MTKAKPLSLADEVVAGLQKKGPPAWHENIPTSIMTELEAIRADFRGGKMKTTKTTLSRSISKAMKARGHAVGDHAVVKWLMAD